MATKTGAVILAAGSASRMGTTKQLLQYRGHTLVEHAILQAQEAGFAPVVVVLGAEAEQVSEAVGRTTAEPVVNENWQSGMGSSLRTGLATMLELAPDVAGIAILLADQPCVASQQLSEMLRVFEAGRSPIVAASYAGTIGVPAIFRNTVFSKLRDLPPDAGARWLLRESGAEIERFELPEAATDVDTPEDFSALR